MDTKPTESQIRDVFKQFGEIKAVDWGNNCAYVEYMAVESAKSALGKTVSVLGTEVRILMRRIVYPQQYHIHDNRRVSNNITVSVGSQPSPQLSSTEPQTRLSNTIKYQTRGARAQQPNAN
jgi:hypothetical protein